MVCNLTVRSWQLRPSSYSSFAGFYLFASGLPWAELYERSALSLPFAENICGNLKALVSRRGATFAGRAALASQARSGIDAHTHACTPCGQLDAGHPGPVCGRREQRE